MKCSHYNFPTFTTNSIKLEIKVTKNLTWEQLSMIYSLMCSQMLLFTLTGFRMLIGWQAKEMEYMLCLNSIFYWAIWRTATTFRWWIGWAKYSNKYPKGWIWKIIHHLALSMWAGSTWHFCHIKEGGRLCFSGYSGHWILRESMSGRRPLVA